MSRLVGTGNGFVRTESWEQQVNICVGGYSDKDRYIFRGNTGTPWNIQVIFGFSPDAEPGGNWTRQVLEGKDVGGINTRVGSPILTRNPDAENVLLSCIAGIQNRSEGELFCPLAQRNRKRDDFSTEVVELRVYLFIITLHY